MSNKFKRNRQDLFWFEVRVTVWVIALGLAFAVGFDWKLNNIMDNQQTIIEMQTSHMKTVLRMENELAQMRSELCQPWEQKVKP